MAEHTCRLADKDELEQLQREVAAIGAAEDKDVYFLLATASAAIFVALQRTSQLGFQESQVMLGVAVFFWAASFIAGCINRQSDISKLAERFSARAMEFVISFTEFDAGPEAKYSVLSEMVERLRKDSASAATKAHMTARIYYLLQFRLLVLGGIFFLVWHLIEMWLRTA